MCPLRLNWVSQVPYIREILRPKFCMLILRAHGPHATWPQRTRVEDKERWYLRGWNSKNKVSLAWLMPAVRFLLQCCPFTCYQFCHLQQRRTVRHCVSYWHRTLSDPCSTEICLQVFLCCLNKCASMAFIQPYCSAASLSLLLISLSLICIVSFRISPSSFRWGFHVDVRGWKRQYSRKHIIPFRLSLSPLPPPPWFLPVYPPCCFWFTSFLRTCLSFYPSFSYISS